MVICNLTNQTNSIINMVGNKGNELSELYINNEENDGEIELNGNRNIS